jgi:hypothetical protein
MVQTKVVAATERHSYPVVSVLFWAALGVSGFLLDSRTSFSGHDLAIRFLSCAAVAFGVWLFWRDGGTHRITAVGIYGLSFALFVGVAGLYIALVWNWATEALVVALLLAYAGQVLMFAIFWYRQPARRAQTPQLDDGPQVTRWGMVVGTVMLAAGLGGARGGLVLGGLVDASVFVGAVLLALSVFLRRGRGSSVAGLAIAGAVFCLYAVYLFRGFGRLTLGALGFALALAAAQRLRAGWIKFGLLASMTPALLVLSRLRVEFTASLNPNQGPDVTGFESLASPLLRFSQLIDLIQGGALHIRFGETFLSSAVALFPRALWPNKPVGLGAELAAIFRPELAGSGHSELALFHGEWLYNFGLVGLAVMIPVVGLLVGASSRLLVQTSNQPLASRAHLIGLAAAIVAASGLPDLLWGGTDTYVARAGERLAVLLFVFLLFSRPFIMRAARRQSFEKESTTLREQRAV